MNNINIIDYFKTYVNSRYSKDSKDIKDCKDSKELDTIEHKLLFKNSLAERILSKILFNYSSKHEHSFELENIVNVLKDPKSTNESEFVNEVLKSNFDLKSESIQFFEK